MRWTMAIYVTWTDETVHMNADKLQLNIHSSSLDQLPDTMGNNDRLIPIFSVMTNTKW